MSRSASSGRAASSARTAKRAVVYLYVAAFVAAFSAVAYELLLASYATFLLGASIFQYSLVVSLMMASMGFGALLTHRLRFPLLDSFLGVELVLAAVAAVALPTLYLVFALGLPARFVMGTFVVAMGAMIGMEIPLLSQMGTSSTWLSRILFFDYLGGFLGGILFPIFLVPQLGLFRVAALLSVLNSGVAVALLFPFRKALGKRFPRWAAAAVAMLAVSLCGLVLADGIRILMETKLFGIQQ